MKPKLIVALVGIILFLILLAQNTQVVTLRVYFWKISMSQIILIPIIMILGFVIGYIVAKVRGNGSHRTKAGSYGQGRSLPKH